MNVRIFGSSEEAGRAAAAAVAAQLARKPASVLGLPTGRTSVLVYDALAALHEAGQADFSRAHTFNIDEFVGVSSSDAHSYYAFMQQYLFSRVNLPASHVHFLDGTAVNAAAECARFEGELASLGGMDLLLVGVGTNAHIGFNEPGRMLHTRSHRVRLALDTRRANSLLFGGHLDKVPREALTMGMGTLFDARTIVVIATGPSKSRAIAAMFGGRVTTAQPASLLQLHPNVEVILDSAAAEKLSESGLAAQP